MTNDRNMGNIETANQSNLVSAHGIFNMTNDKQLRQFKEIRSITVDELR